MASDIKFNRLALEAAFDDIATQLRLAAEEGMQKVVDRAADDARGIYNWNRPGDQEQEYPNGTVWQWEVTGMAAASIQGYVVPNKRLRGQADRLTTSYKNGAPRQHPHWTDDAVTQDHAPDPDKVIGVVTMNIGYAPYLQEWEQETFGQPPVTVTVFEAFWSRVYVPTVLRPTIERAMRSVARKYT
jgi:hypothetical protein